MCQTTRGRVLDCGTTMEALMRTWNVLKVALVVGAVALGSPAVRAADKDVDAPPKVITWEKDLDRAYCKAQEQKKALVVFFFCPLDDETCVNCKRFRTAVFSDEFAALADRALFVQVSVTLRKGEKAPDELAQRLFDKLECKSTPTVVVLEPNPKVVAELGRVTGRTDAKELTEYVRVVLADWVKGGRKVREPAATNKR